jgi:DNA-directed RNA polymerase subunit alpha
MRGPKIDLEGLDAFLAISRTADEAFAAEAARLRERDPLTIPIGELELWPSAFSSLVHAGFETLGDVCARTAGDLMGDLGLGERAVEEVREALAEFGLKLKGG